MLRFWKWWRHYIEMFSAMLAHCAGNHRWPVNSTHSQRANNAVMWRTISSLFLAGLLNRRSMNKWIERTWRSSDVTAKAVVMLSRYGNWSHRSNRIMMKCGLETWYSIKYDYCKLMCNTRFIKWNIFALFGFGFLKTCWWFIFSEHLRLLHQHLSNHIILYGNIFRSLQWHHNGRDGVSNHRRLDCLPKCLFTCRSKKTSKLRTTGLCEGNPPVTGGFPSERASNAENVSIWWRRHVFSVFHWIYLCFTYFLPSRTPQKWVYLKTHFHMTNSVLSTRQSETI